MSISWDRLQAVETQQCGSGHLFTGQDKDNHRLRFRPKDHNQADLTAVSYVIFTSTTVLAASSFLMEAQNGV